MLQFSGGWLFFLWKHPDIFFEKMKWFSKLPVFFVFWEGLPFTTKAIVLASELIPGWKYQHFQKSHSLVLGPKHPCIHRALVVGSERKDPGGPSVSIELNYYQQNQHKTHIFFEPGRKHGDEEHNRFELHELPKREKEVNWCQVLWMLVFFWWFRKITIYCNHWIWPYQFLHDITSEENKKPIMETAISRKIWQKSPNFITPLTWQFCTKP